MKKMYSVLTTLCALTIFTGDSLVAQGKKDDQIFILPVEESNIEAYRSALVPQELRNQDDFFKMEGNLDNDDFMYLSRIEPSANYFPDAIAPKGDHLGLYDGSLWYVCPSQRESVKHWVKEDKLFIKPNVTWFSTYQYVLQNRRIEDLDKRIVEVDLINPPLPTGAYTRYVKEINRASRMVILNDGVVWYINPADSSFDAWAEGHRILIGVNNKWRSATYPHILINTGIYTTKFTPKGFKKRYPYSEACVIRY